ncbi:MAG: hypothetical protein ABSC22_03775 [Roseiarcus sp.]
MRAGVDAVNRDFMVSPQMSFTERLRRLPNLRISSSSMRHSPYRSAALSIFVGAVICVGQIGGGRAGEAHSFIIAANDGYGVQDCLGEGGECGRVVADAWCEAHGHGAALSFGRADDVTGAINAATNPGASYVVTCGE